MTSSQPRSLAALALALGMLPAGADAEVADLTLADVTPAAFSVIWASDQPVADASVRVFADAAGTSEITAGLEVELASSGTSLALGIVKVRVIGVASGTCVYVQTLTTVGAVETAFPAQSPFREVCTQTSQDRVDAVGRPIVNDVLRLGADDLPLTDGSLVLVAAPDFATYPLSAFVGEAGVTGVARVNLNNLFAKSGGSAPTPENTVLWVTEFRGNACGLAQHKLLRFRYVPDHLESALVGSEISELEVPDSCGFADANCDGRISILDAQRVLNLFGSTLGQCRYNPDLDAPTTVSAAVPASGTPATGLAIPAASGGDGVINILDVQAPLNDFGANPRRERRLEQAKNELCLYREVVRADDRLQQILGEADPAADAEIIETATAFRALTRLLRPLAEGQGNATPEVDTISEVLARLGFAPDERNVFDLPRGGVFRNDGTCAEPVAPLFESDVERALRAELLPPLADSLASIEDFRSDWSTTCRVVRLGELDRIEIDSADLLLLSSLEHALRAALGLLEAYDRDFDVGAACETYNATVALCDDPARTLFAGGPGSAACDNFSGDPVACELAWHRSANGSPASCFADGDTCLGCGPNNEAAGRCTNACGPPETADEAIAPFLAANPGFLTLADAGAAQAARVEATTAVTLLGEAPSAMQDETDDPLDDLVSLTPRGVQFLDLELAGVLDSLAGAAVPAPPLAMCPVVDVDLGVLFDGLGLRALLPPFPGDVVDWTQLPDISFGGILPGVAQDELFCLLDSTAPEIVGLPDGGIIEPSPFDLAFDIVDPASGSLPGGNVDPTSVRILLSGLRPIVGPFEDTCTLSIEGVEVAPSADPLVPVDVTALLAPTQNVDGSVSVAGSLAVVTDSERGCFVDLQVKARDESGNGLSTFPTLQLITGGAIARFDPPGGDVPSPFTLTIVDEEPFGEGLGSVVLSAFACEEVIVNGTSLAGDLSQEDISSLLTFTPTGDDSFTLTGTIETGVRCHIGVFAEVLSGPFVAHFDGVSYQVFP